MNTGNNLIFLVSQPRAGSTLLQKILGAHPAVHTVSEPWIALHPLFALKSEGVSAIYSHRLAREATSEFLAHLPGGEATYFEGVRRMLGHLYDSALDSSGKSIFLDKSPRYYLVIEELRRTFPEARFVFLVRNPLAVLASILETWVKAPYFSDLYSLRIDFVHDLLTAPDCIRSAIPSATSVVHYENLVQSPQAATARLCRDLNIDFLPRMIEYGAEAGTNERWAFGDQGTVYRESRPVTARTERWRQTLNGTPAWQKLAIGYLEALGPALLDDLGYSYKGLRSALGARKDVAEVPDFLKTAVLTPVFGETNDFASQFLAFQRRIASHSEEASLRLQTPKVSGA